MKTAQELSLLTEKSSKPLSERGPSFQDIMEELMEVGSDLEQYAQELKSVIPEIDAGTGDDADTKKLKDDANKLLSALNKVVRDWGEIDRLATKLSGND